MGLIIQVLFNYLLTFIVIFTVTYFIYIIFKAFGENGIFEPQERVIGEDLGVVKRKKP